MSSKIMNVNDNSKVIKQAIIKDMNQIVANSNATQKNAITKNNQQNQKKGSRPNSALKKTNKNNKGTENSKINNNDKKENVNAIKKNEKTQQLNNEKNKNVQINNTPNNKKSKATSFNAMSMNAFTNKEMKKGDTICFEDTYKLWNFWNLYRNKYDQSSKLEGNNAGAVRNNDLNNQLSGIEDMKFKYTYQPEGKPEQHFIHKKQLLQEQLEINRNKQIRNRAQKVLIQRYNKKMEDFIKDYKKSYQAYQNKIKEKLGTQENTKQKFTFTNNPTNVTNGRMKRLEKKALKQQQYFDEMEAQLNSKKVFQYPIFWSTSNENLFNKAVEMILTPVYNASHYFSRPEYQNNLAWVDRNNNPNCIKEFSVASVLANTYSPIPEECNRYNSSSTNIPVNQQKFSAKQLNRKSINQQNQQRQIQKLRNRESISAPQNENRNDSSSSANRNAKTQQAPLIIKMQAPNQNPILVGENKNRNNKNSRNNNSNSNNNRNGKKSLKNRKIILFNDEPASPTVIIPEPSVWVKEEELPEKMNWGIVQLSSPLSSPSTQQFNSNKKKVNSSNGKNSNSEEAMNLLFSDFNNYKQVISNKQDKQQQQQQQKKKRNNRKPKGYYLSDKLK